MFALLSRCSVPFIARERAPCVCDILLSIEMPRAGAPRNGPFDGHCTY